MLFRGRCDPRGAMASEEWFVYTGEEPVPKNVTHVRFASSVTAAGEEAFDGCLGLKVVVLNDGLRTIELWAFRDCVSLKCIKLNEGLQIIGYGAFRGCTSLESVKFPSTVISVKSAAFNGCKELKEVLLNCGLQKIGPAAFGRSVSLRSIVLPSTVSEIGKYAFGRCAKLNKVVLGEGFQIIGWGAFDGCGELKDLELCEGLQTIGRYGFRRCNSLESIRCPFITNRLKHIAPNDQMKVENKINEIPNVSIRGGEVLISGAAMREGENEDNWKTCRASLGHILDLISYFQLKEATAIFELALWKANIEETCANANSREACRIEVPGPVKDAILQYFDTHAVSEW